MTVYQIIKAAREELAREPWRDASEWSFMAEPEVEARAVYIGSYMALDPCGRYHHILSPNGATRRCERFWEALDRQCTRRELSLESGEGDPTDIFIVEYREAKHDDRDE